MKSPVFAVLIILLLIGNLFGAYKLFTEKAEFFEKFPLLSSSGYDLFKYLPLVNSAALIGLLFWQKWAVYLSIAAALTVISFDIYFGIKYHLYVAIPSTLILLLLIIYYWKNFK